MKLNPKYQNLFFPLLLILIPIAIYSNSLHVPFQYDDYTNFVNNERLHLKNLSPSEIIRVSFGSLSKNRPVSNLSLALTYYFYKDNVIGYHIGNILIHILTGLFLYLFLQSTLRTDNAYNVHNKSLRSISFLSAAIWVCHPVHTQSVTYIVQRMNSLATMFYILSLFLYVCGRKSKNKQWATCFYLGCFLNGLLAIGSKEIAATLPCFIWLYEWLIFQNGNFNWLKRQRYLLGGIIGVVAILSTLYLAKNNWTIFSLYEQQDFTLKERLLTEHRVVLWYLSLLLFPLPSRMSLLHDFTISHSLGEPITTLAILGVWCFFLIGVYFCRREKLIAFCIFWFLGNLVVESSFIGLALVFEHRTYLPSMMICFLLVIVIYRLLNRPIPRRIVFCAIICLLSLGTIQRNTVWSDQLKLWEDCVKKASKNPIAHYNCGYYDLKNGNEDKALERLEMAVALKADYPEALNALAWIYATHKNINRRNGEKAVSLVNKAIKLDGRRLDFLDTLAVALAESGDYRSAVKVANEAFELANSVGMNKMASKIHQKIVTWQDKKNNFN